MAILTMEQVPIEIILYLLWLYLLQVPIEIIGGNCPEQNAFVAALYEKEHDKSLATARGLPSPYP